MNPYYKTLEIEQGADQPAIKKAYFKMIRKFPPDKHPEEFKKIREAYDYLQNEENLKQLERAAEIEPEFEKPYYQVLEYYKKHQLDKAISLCQEVLKVAEMLPFQFLLATYYNENGNYGKATVLWEKLISKEKENPEMLLGLMQAYHGRKWVQKAINIGERLEILQYENLTFYHVYVLIWNSRVDFQPILDIALKAIALYESMEKHTLQEAEHLCGTLQCMLQREMEDRLPSFQEDVLRVENIIAKGIQDPVCGKIFANRARLLYRAIAAYVEVCSECLPAMSRYQVILQSGIHYYSEEEWENCVGVEYRTVCMDEDIKDSLKHDISFWYHNYLFSMQGSGNSVKLEKVEEKKKKYDILVYWSKKLDKLRPSLRKIADFYPFLAGSLSPFLEEMLEGKGAEVGKKYEKIYKSLMGLKASAELVLDDICWAGDELVKTYRRDSRKVGRNDPCPCGSCKKYKHCCGNQ